MSIAFMGEYEPTLTITSPPRVSVITLVYRPNPNFLAEAIDSILGQSMRDFELLVVETPSDQPASRVLREYQDSRIRHVMGHAGARLIEQRNLGLNRACAPLVAVLDDDDIAHPDRLRKQVEFLDTHPDIDLVGTQVAIIDSADRIIGYRVFPVEYDDILKELPRIVPFAQTGVTFRRDVVLAAGGYTFEDYNVAEDYELWSRLAYQGVRFTNLPEVLQYYRYHTEQLKATRLRETILGVLRVKQLYWRSNQSFRGRIRMLAETLMLCLPSRWVHRLLRSMHYNAAPRTHPPLAAAAPPSDFLCSRIAPRPLRIRLSPQPERQRLLTAGVSSLRAVPQLQQDGPT